MYNNSNCSDVNNKLTNLTNNVKPAQDFDEIKHRLDSEINNNFKLREEIKLINSKFLFVCWERENLRSKEIFSIVCYRSIHI